MIQITIMSVCVVAALICSLVTSIDIQVCFTKKKINEAEQGIGSDTTTLQGTMYGSDNDSLALWNNVGLSFNLKYDSNEVDQQ